MTKILRGVKKVFQKVRGPKRYSEIWIPVRMNITTLTDNKSISTLVEYERKSLNIFHESLTKVNFK